VASKAEFLGGTVPLSEHEQRQLEQIEQALYADHPRLARIMRAKDPKVHYRRRVVQGAICFLVGIGMVAAGFVLKHFWLEIAGFAVMLASILWAVMSYRRMAGVLANRRSGHAGPRRPGLRDRRAVRRANGSMMERLEVRWRRRQERGR
jgi:Protein of unknown function (DUF3040)